MSRQPASFNSAMDLERIRRAVREILLAVGEDPDREGLRETPDRVARMYAEVFEGLHQDPRGHLQKLFTQKYDEMVLIKDIRLVSFCEHHLLPVVGQAHVAYIPNGKVIGLSKIPRVVDVLAKRPQMQERLTEELADLLMKRARRQGRCRRDRGEPQLHDDPRSQEARQHVCHQCDEGRLQGTARDAVRGHVADLRHARLSAARPGAARSRWIREREA